MLIRLLRFNRFSQGERVWLSQRDPGSGASPTFQFGVDHIIEGDDTIRIEERDQPHFLQRGYGLLTRTPGGHAERESSAGDKSLDRLDQDRHRQHGFRLRLDRTLAVFQRLTQLVTHVPERPAMIQQTATRRRTLDGDRTELLQQLDTTQFRLFMKQLFEERFDGLPSQSA